MATREIIHTQQRDTDVGASLPFSGLDELQFGHVISGPRISLSMYRTRAYYAVTIRNYLAGHTKKSLRLRANRVSDVKAFVALPVELQLLIVDHLHPIDLYHFSQVSRYFRQLVLHPAALSVWKSAFMRHPDLPTPPPGVKEAEWAFMIYGPGICGVCGKHGALTDFGLQKRFCGPCLNTHTLPQGAFRNESKRISPQHIIWTLLPYTCRSSGIRHPRGIARFLKTDFILMWKKLQLIQILRKNGLKVLSPLYADYISARQIYIRKLNNSAGKSNLWADSIFRQLAEEYDNLTFQLTKKCITRLRSLGHDARDTGSAFDLIRHVIRHKPVYRLTRRAFREIRPRIEVLLKRFRTDRIKAERRNLLLPIYSDYLKSRSPDERSYLPKIDTPSILGTELFKKILGPPFDEDITPGNVAPFLPEFTDKWIKARREKFAGVLPKYPDETMEARVQRLELVTSPMSCGSCTDNRLLIGWKGLCRHWINAGERCRGYMITGGAVAAATLLVSCVGLDPLTTTVDDMNRRNDRFVCGNCCPEVRRRRASKPVFTWLECLEHAMKHIHDKGHATPVWLPLSPPAVRFVRGHEKPYPDPSIDIWCCNHCADHFEKQVPQADAIGHVESVHCIRIPAIGVDVVADPRKGIHKRREPFRLTLDPVQDHICKHCSDMPMFTLWEKYRLMKHLIGKHHIPEPAEHVDWEAVPVVALSTEAVLT